MESAKKITLSEIFGAVKDYPMARSIASLGASFLLTPGVFVCQWYPILAALGSETALLLGFYFCWVVAHSAWLKRFVGGDANPAETEGQGVFLPPSCLGMSRSCWVT